MESSYLENNYREVFFSIVETSQPRTLVELGILNGYSTQAIVDAMSSNNFGTFDAYDLFEDYEFNHGVESEIRERFKDSPYVTIHKADAFTVHEKYEDNSVDFLHVDLHNDGETVKKIMELWHPKFVYGALILFEGGSEERDQVEWMLKYNKAPMKPELETNKIIEDNNYVFATYLKFPGLTVLLKKS